MEDMLKGIGCFLSGIVLFCLSIGIALGYTLAQ